MRGKTGVAGSIEFKPVRFIARTGGGSVPKLGRDDIPTIRKMLRAGKTRVEIAAVFGVSGPTVCNFIRRVGIFTGTRKL